MTTETDRELLELAARARGGIKYFNDAFRSAETGYREWNPLTDDGDALRLAVDMEISFCRNHELVFANMSADPSDPEQSWAITEEILDCAHKATRRAITRAAAEIGRGMA